MAIRSVSHVIKDTSTRPPRIIGRTQGISSLNVPTSLNYLAVRLRAGESWRYQPDIHHTVCWLALSAGQLVVPDTVEAGELAIFEPSNHAVHIHAKALRILFSVRLQPTLTALCSENTRCIPALQRCVRVSSGSARFNNV